MSSFLPGSPWRNVKSASVSVSFIAHEMSPAMTTVSVGLTMAFQLAVSRSS